MSDQDRTRERNKPATPTRVPPHSIEAEEALIGAALLAPKAAAQFADRVTPSDFYKPQHRWIADAIVALVAADEPVDVVTVAERLRRAGSLVDAGGIEALHALQNHAPSISGAEHYAKIVNDTARLRRLLFSATEIADLAYSTTEEPAAAVARAQDLLEQLATTSSVSLSTLDIADLATLLAGDLVPEEPAILVRSDGAALFYSGKMHMLQAEPSSGKSWIALAAAVEILMLGGTVIYLDFEDTAIGILLRLLALGATPQAIRDRFVHINPAGAFGVAERVDLARVIDRLNPDLVIIDGVAEALSRSGYSEDKADDMVRWTDQLPRWISKTGAAVVMLDHVAKDPEQRGRWARGTGAKLAVIDGATYQVKVVRSFSRHSGGAVKLIVAKDRPGGVGPIGHVAALLTIEPSGNGAHVKITVDPDSAEVAPTDTWKPTIMMGRVSQLLEESTAPLTATAVRSMIHTDKKQMVTEAIARLTAEGYIVQTGGRTKTLKLVRPYTDAPHARPLPIEPPAPLFDPDEFGHPELVPVEPDWLRDASRAAVEADIAQTERDRQ